MPEKKGDQLGACARSSVRPTHLVLGYWWRATFVEVPIEALQRDGLSSSVGESRLVVSRPLAARVLGLERVLQRRQQRTKHVLDTLGVQIFAIARVGLALAQSREGLEVRGHLERWSTEVAETFDALAEGSEDVGRLRDGEGEIASVDERGSVDEGEGDASRREEGLETALNGELFRAELKERMVSIPTDMKR